MELNFNSIPMEYKVAIGAVFAIVVLSVLAYVSRPSTLSMDLREMVRHSAQLYEISRQDTDAAIALQHATQAVAYLSIARRLATDATIQKMCKVSPSDLERLLLERQAQCVSAITTREATLPSLVAGYAALQ